MFASAFAALVLFAAPDAGQSGETAAPQGKAPAAEAKAPKKICYTSTPSGSRMPRKTCVTQSPKAEDGAEHSADKAPAPKTQ